MTSTRHGLVVFALLSILGGLVDTSHALPISDFSNPTDIWLISGSTPSPCPTGFTCTTGALSFLHDISDSGFVPGVDTITSAAIAIHLMDSTGSESYTFTFGAGQTFSSVNVPGGVNGSTDTVPLSVAPLLDLATDGKINVKVEATSGSFFFADALLTAQVTKGTSDPGGSSPPAAVPEPAPLFLLASALPVIVWAWRARRYGASSRQVGMVRAGNSR